MKASIWRIAVASVLVFGCATAPTRPPSVNVTGRWVGDFSGPWGTVGATMNLQQKDAKVTGDIVVPGATEFSGPVVGTVEGDVFSYVLVNRTGGADLTVKGNEMAGTTKAGSRLVVRRAQ